MQRKADGHAIHKQTLMTFHNRKSLQLGEEIIKSMDRISASIPRFNNTELFSVNLMGILQT